MSGPMPRDASDRCIRQDKKVAGQSRRRYDPPRETKVFFRITADDFDRIAALMKQCGYENLSYADFYLNAADALAFLYLVGPMPRWSKLKQVREDKPDGRA